MFCNLVIVFADVSFPALGNMHQEIIMLKV